VVENTLERLRANQQQTRPPTARPNPDAARAPNTGGSPNGDITGRLTEAQRGAIGEKVRECWTKDAGALEIERQSVQLKVTYDEAGVVRIAEVGADDQPRLSDPRFRAFAERAVRAVRDPRCASLPLPRPELGKVGQLTFRFRP
jgi:hypothetical protein